MHPIAISIVEAGQSLGLGRTTIYSLINQGKLDTIKIGRRRLVKMESVRRLMEAGA